MGVPGVLIIACGVGAAFVAFVATYSIAVSVHDLLAATLKKKELLIRAGLTIGLSSVQQSDIFSSDSSGAVRLGLSQPWLGLAVRWFAQLTSMAGVAQRTGTLLEFALLFNFVALASGILFSQIILGLLFAVAGDIGLYVWLTGRAKRRLNSIKQQLPDMLDSIAQSLRAGLSLGQAIARTAKAAELPISQYLDILATDVAAGRTMGEALSHFRLVAPIHDLKAICTALDIQCRAGGNVPQMLSRSAGLLRQSLMLERSLVTQTAQSRMSIRLVGVVPLCLVGLMIVVMPGYLDIFVGTNAGRIMMAIAVILDVGGFLWIRRVSKVEVSNQ